MDAEVKMLNESIHEKKTLILGGSKVEDKLGVIDNLIGTSDYILLGGAMCFTFLKAKGYSVGSSIVSDEKLDYCKNILDTENDKILLPLDVVTQNGVKDIDDLNLEDVGYDIGPKTIKKYKEILSKSKFVLWNGPLGKYEEKEYENGTKEIMKYLSDNKIKTLIAGGDIISASKKFNVLF